MSLGYQENSNSAHWWKNAEYFEPIIDFYMDTGVSREDITRTKTQVRTARSIVLRVQDIFDSIEELKKNYEYRGAMNYLLVKMFMERDFEDVILEYLTEALVNLWTKKIVNVH